MALKTEICAHDRGTNESKEKQQESEKQNHKSAERQKSRQLSTDRIIDEKIDRKIELFPGNFWNLVSDGSISFRKEGKGMSFSELKQKDVINICDGRKIGKPIDLILNEHACVEALVVPGPMGGFLGLLKPDHEGYVIPWRQVRRIGDDVILVEIDESRQ